MARSAVWGAMADQPRPAGKSWHVWFLCLVERTSSHEATLGVSDEDDADDGYGPRSDQRRQAPERGTEPVAVESEQGYRVAHRGDGST